MLDKLELLQDTREIETQDLLRFRVALHNCDTWAAQFEPLETDSFHVLPGRLLELEPTETLFHWIARTVRIFNLKEPKKLYKWKQTSGKRR